MEQIKKQSIIEVRIDNVVFGGKGIGRFNHGGNEIVVFVSDCAPGDVVRAKILAMKNNFWEAAAVEIVKRSEMRIEPRCKHFGSCGGCSWQFLKIEDQLKIKKTIVEDALVRIGGFKEEFIKEIGEEILGKENEWNYRNKMDFSFFVNRDGVASFGLHKKGMFYELEEIEECFLTRPWMGEAVKWCREYFNLKGINKNWKSLIVRCGINSGEILFNLVIENEEPEWISKWSEELLIFSKKIISDSEKVAGIVFSQVINKKGQSKKTIRKVLSGKDFYLEKLILAGGKTLEFEVDCDAFFQPNTRQAEILYSLVKEMAELDGEQIIIDLFCGTGTIGIVLADSAKKIIGVELNFASVESAKKNALKNKISNIEFIVGDAGKTLAGLAVKKQHIDLIIVDPPRAGLDEKAVKMLLEFAPEKIIYVSCNPTTQARDLKILCEEKYQLKKFVPVDQFGQTYHVENVAICEAKR